MKISKLSYSNDLMHSQMQVIVGIGAKPVVSPFEVVGLNTDVGGIQVQGFLSCFCNFMHL